MVVRKREGSLSKEEKSVVKALLNKGWRNQDIQSLLNKHRKATVNSARITEVKKAKRITSASIIRPMILIRIPTLGWIIWLVVF